MKAISLWQPWASAIALGLKKIETRSRLTFYRGELAICASLRTDPLQQTLFEGLLERDCSIKFTFEQSLAKTDPQIKDLPLGCVVAVADLFDVQPAAMFTTSPQHERPHHISIAQVEWWLGNYDFGRFGWMLRDVRPLKTPVPVVGRQFLFDLPAHVAEKVRAQL